MSIIAVRTILSGDKKRGASLVPLGRKFLFMLAVEMGDRIPVLKRTHSTLPDGSVITVGINHGMAVIDITSPFVEVPVKEEKGGKKDHAYILVRMRGDGSWFTVTEVDGSTSEYPPIYPSITIKDMCFVYDIEQREVHPEIGFADYDSNVIKDFLAENTEVTHIPLWNVRIVGQEKYDDVNENGEAITRWYQPEGLFYNTDVILPVHTVEGLLPKASNNVVDINYTLNEDDLGLPVGGDSPLIRIWHRDLTYSFTSEMWVGDMYLGTVKPISYRLDYLGNFREEGKTDPLHTSFQVKYSQNDIRLDFWEPVNNLPQWAFGDKDNLKFELLTTLGALGAYSICGNSYYYHKYRPPTPIITNEGLVWTYHGHELISEPPRLEGYEPYLYTDRYYAGEERLPGYPFYPPWYINFGPTNKQFTRGYITRIGESYGDFKDTNLGRYDSPDREINKNGSRIMTQIYTCQMRKRVEDRVAWNFGWSLFDEVLGETHLVGLYLDDLIPGFPKDILNIDEVTYRADYVPSDGSFEIRTPHEETRILGSDEETGAKVVTLEDYQKLGMCVLAGADVYPDASLVDPREQKLDPVLTAAVIKLWLLIYDQEYMQAPWDYETTWASKVRTDHHLCPPFILEVKHFEPTLEED